MARVGDRVGAILSATNREVKLLGYGIFKGNLEPPDDTRTPFGTAGEINKMARENGGDPWTNPCIELDDGRIVWGCQCWWGDEDEVRHSIKDRTVVVVDLEGNPITS